MSRDDKKIFFIVLFSKITYCIFAIFVFSRFSQLGDTESYISGHYLYRNDYTSPAFILSYIGSNFGEYGSSIFAIVLSSFSIIFLIKKACLSYRVRMLTLILIFLPSFGMWTSILSKEVLVLFFMSICVGLIIDVHARKKIIPSVFEIISFVLLVSLKPHYSLAIFFTYLLLVFRRLGVKNEVLLAISILSIVLIIGASIYYIDDIYRYTQIITNSYFVNGGSTRKNDYWLELFDFFTYAPLGIPKAFIGPTFMEAMNRMSFMPFFIEGVILLCVILFGSFFSVYHRRKINILSLCIFITFTLLLMFTHYPVGIVNPGSSIRYRSGIIFPMVTFIFYLIDINYARKEKNNLHK